MTQGSHPNCRGAGRGLGARGHGCVARCGWHPQGCRRAGSLARDGRALTLLADSAVSLRDTFFFCFSGCLVPSRLKRALVLGNGCKWFCASRSLLGSYVHQELTDVNNTNVFCCV